MISQWCFDTKARGVKNMWKVTICLVHLIILIINVELCNYTKAHQQLVPRSTSNQFTSIQNEIDPTTNTTTSNYLGPSNIQADPPSLCGPISIDCYATIEYRELIILPFSNYTSLSRVSSSLLINKQFPFVKLS